MPAGNSHTKSALTPEARKHLLLVACTIDRVNLLAKWQRPAPVDQWLGPFSSLPWLKPALHMATRLLPRKLQFLVSLGRTIVEARLAR